MSNNSSGNTVAAIKYMKKKNIFTAGVIIIIIIFAITLSRPSTQTGGVEGVYKIGAAYALSGDAAVWGESALNGTKLAVDEINTKGGINGKKIELAVEDIKSSAKDSVTAVSKLQSIDKVDALLVGWLDVYQGAESVLAPNTLMISPDAGTEGVNGVTVHKNVFSTWYRTQPKNELAIKLMAATGKKKLYVITQNDSYYVSAIGFLKEAAAKHGIEIVGIDMLNAGTNMNSVLIKVKEKKPDAVFVALYDEKENVDFLKKWKSLLGNTVAVYGDEFVQQNYNRTDYRPEWFEGFYFYAPRNPDTAFTSTYKTAYGIDPIFGASTAYDSVYMIAKALKDNPADLDSYMRSTTFDTVSYGKVSFDEIGGISTTEDYFVMKQIKDGKPVEVKF